MQPIEKFDVVPLFPGERAALLGVLRSLNGEQWLLPTVCTGWSVKDIASHLVADDLGRLSHGRDGYLASRLDPRTDEDFEEVLRAFINAQNESWVDGTRRMSARVVTDLLEWSGSETQAYFESLDPEAPGMPVSWAGHTESPNWFDLAREYSERWIHQSQVREGVGAPMLYDERLFAPILDTMAFSMPHRMRDQDAAPGAVVRLTVTGPVARAYDIMREPAGWTLGRAGESPPSAGVTMTGDTAWRLFTKGLTAAEALERTKIDGDESLGQHVLGAVAIIA